MIFLKKIIQQIVDKLFCLHDYRLIANIDVYNRHDELPVKTKHTYMCEKCGKTKRVIL